MGHIRIAMFSIVALVGLFGFGCANDTTIILVRHAERQSGQGSDPALTPAGQQRAQALVDVVRHAGVSAIYVTTFQRTQQTAAPSAQALGLTPMIMPISSTPQAHAAAIAADIRTNHAGQTVLVVGHSNTVPLILSELGVTATPTIPETEFDRLFVAIRRKNKATRLIEGTYGQ